MTTAAPDPGVLEALVRRALEVMPGGTFLIDQERRVIWTHPGAAPAMSDWPADVTMTLRELLTPERAVPGQHATQLTAACLHEWELYLLPGVAGRNFVVCGKPPRVRTSLSVPAPPAPTPAFRNVRSPTADGS
jgi:hypothetical protein